MYFSQSSFLPTSLSSSGQSRKQLKLQQAQIQLLSFNPLPGNFPIKCFYREENYFQGLTKVFNFTQETFLFVLFLTARKQQGIFFTLEQLEKQREVCTERFSLERFMKNFEKCLIPCSQNFNIFIFFASQKEKSLTLMFT